MKENLLYFIVYIIVFLLLYLQTNLNCLLSDSYIFKNINCSELESNLKNVLSYKKY